MKNWDKLEADINLILDKHFTGGRAGKKINKIILHHNAGNLTAQGCYNTWQTRPASAHYQVDSNGVISQHVWDTNTAWHAGDYDANCTSIGIEHADISTNPWKISDACLDNGAHLVAALCIYYKLGRPQYGKNVFFHKDFSSTECPASIAGNQKDTYLKKAGEWYDKMTGKTTTPNNPTTNKPTTPAKKNIETIAREVIAGQWGNGTDRTNRLKKAGYDATAIQNKVNALLSKTTPSAKVDLNALADKVIKGEYGNGEERKRRLGPNYAAVQAVVNKKMGW